MPDNSTPQAAIDELVGQAASTTALQSRVDEALARAASAEQTANRAAGAAGVSTTCAVTVVQAGKAGDDTFECPVGSTVAQALSTAGKSSEGCTIKTQSTGGAYARINDPATSTLGEGSHFILLTPRVAGGSLR